MPKIKSATFKPLNLSRKGSIWNDPRTTLIQQLAYEGFTHKAIESVAGISCGYRLHRLGISTSAVRRGETEESQKRLERVLDKLSGRLGLVVRKSKVVDTMQDRGGKYVNGTRPKRKAG